MMIEPVGSVMTVQAQPVSVPKPATQSEKPEVSAESASVQAAEKVDKTINVVENAQGKGQSAGQDQGKGQSQQTVTNEQIRKAVEQINKNIISNSEAVFGIHEGTNRVTIKIVDKSTKEVIKELPPEKTLDMIAKVWEMAGILVDERR